MKGFLRELLINVMLGLLIFALLRTGVQRVDVIGPSMEPSFQNEQSLIVNKVAYLFHPPERGDVIIFHPPNHDEVLIKRVIALPGDTVEIKNRTVYINGSPLDEKEYTKEPPAYTFYPDKIPQDSYFVLGDNRNNSDDSHTGWVVPRQNIIGKVWLSIWPPSEWGVVPTYSLKDQIGDTTKDMLALLAVN